MALLIMTVVGLGIWVSRTHGDLDVNRAELSRTSQAMTIVAHADRRWDFEGTGAAPAADGYLAYSREMSATVLVVYGLPEERADAYLAWTLKGDVRTKLGPMYIMDHGLWMIIRGEVELLDVVGITLKSPEQPQGLVVATVVLTEN